MGERVTPVGLASWTVLSRASIRRPGLRFDAPLHSGVHEYTAYPFKPGGLKWPKPSVVVTLHVERVKLLIHFHDAGELVFPKDADQVPPLAAQSDPSMVAVATASRSPTTQASFSSSAQPDVRTRAKIRYQNICTSAATPLSRPRALADINETSNPHHECHQPEKRPKVPAPQDKTTPA